MNPREGGSCSGFSLSDGARNNIARLGDLFLKPRDPGLQKVAYSNYTSVDAAAITRYGQIVLHRPCARQRVRSPFYHIIRCPSCTSMAWGLASALQHSIHD